MDKIKVELLSYSPIKNIIIGARTCWQSFNRDDYIDEKNIGKNNKELLKKLIQIYKHESISEHLYYTFRIKKVSRLFLQELARHRIASLSVESTRYTLKRLLKKDKDIIKAFFEDGDYSFDGDMDIIRNIVKKYMVVPEDYDDEDYQDMFLELYILIKKLDKYTNDKAKYFLPESWRTEIVWTINVRSLRNFLNLRLDKKAHFEIRQIASLIIDILPENHRFLYEDILNEKLGR